MVYPRGDCKEKGPGIICMRIGIVIGPTLKDNMTIPTVVLPLLSNFLMKREEVDKVFGSTLMFGNKPRL